jgi:hypothetical protein
LQLHKL